MTIPNSEIQGPPFGCPECANEGKRVSYNGRAALSTHRMQHGVRGTSTNSKAFKSVKRRTYTKRTHAVSFKRGPYNKTKQGKISPLLAMLDNPSRFISELDSLLMNKREEIASLQHRITELNDSVNTLERFRSTVSREEVTRTMSEVA